MFFFDQIAHFGPSPALVDEDGNATSYAELTALAEQVQEHLKSRALAFLLADNCRESVAGYLGCLRARTVVALQPAGIHPALLANLVGTYLPHFLWLPRERSNEVAGTVRFELGGYVLLETDAAPLVPYEELGVLVSTSGSTGSPKLVRQSYRGLAANTESIVGYLHLDANERPITTLPMSYVYGLSVINSHLACGACVVLTRKSLTEKGFWEALKKNRATSLAGVPYTYETLKRLRFARMNLPSVKTLTQAGGKLEAATVLEFAQACRDKGMRFVVMYGAAEATARMAYLPPERALEKPGSIGIAIPGGELWVEDDQGQVIQEPNVVGELVYRGTNVVLGYATCREDLRLGDERGGVLRTGDLARFDEERYFTIVGRRSRFIKVFGNRVNLEELEQHLGKRAIDCACAGEDERLRIYITDGARQDEVSSFVEELTRLHHSAFQVVVVDLIPRTESGKVQYAALS